MRNVQMCILSWAKRAEIQLRQNSSQFEGSPTAEHPVVILNTSCEAVNQYICIYLFISLSYKKR
jgi:hypothetical protein